MNPAARAVRRETSLGLTQAVHRSRALSRAGLESLAEGQQVTLGVVDGQKGREASSINVED